MSTAEAESAAAVTETDPIPVALEALSDLKELWLYDKKLADVVNRARCEAPLRRRGAAVSVSDQRELVADTHSGEKGGYNGLFASYFRALDDKPLITKVITAGVYFGFDGFCEQALVVKTAATETLTFSTFLAALQSKTIVIYAVLAALWVAPVAHYWFGALDGVTKDSGNIADSPSPSFTRRMFKALKKVSLDETVGAFIINAGFLFLFVFVEELTAGTGGMEAGRKAGCRVKDGLWGTMFVCWKLWPMENTVNFVPAKLRVLFLNSLGLEGSIYLSSDDVSVLGFVAICVFYSSLLVLRRCGEA